MKEICSILGERNINYLRKQKLEGTTFVDIFAPSLKLCIYVMVDDDFVIGQVNVRLVKNKQVPEKLGYLSLIHI